LNIHRPLFLNSVIYFLYIIFIDILFEVLSAQKCK
jgi:hypothetical protein